MLVGMKQFELEIWILHKEGRAIALPFVCSGIGFQPVISTVREWLKFSEITRLRFGLVIRSAPSAD